MSRIVRNDATIYTVVVRENGPEMNTQNIHNAVILAKYTNREHGVHVAD